MKSKDKSFTSNITKTIVILVISAIVIISVVLRISDLYIKDEYKSFFITLVSAFFGGLCTLIGVLITFRFTRKQENEKTKDCNKPILYIPQLYDVTKTIQIVAKINNDSNVVPNNKVVLRNTDKAPFIIEKVVVNSDDMYLDSLLCIDKKELFCISFYSSDRVESFRAIIKSVDDYKYEVSVCFENGRPTSMKVIDYVN